jgi:hypothetical protein
MLTDNALRTNKSDSYKPLICNAKADHSLQNKKPTLVREGRAPASNAA